MGAQKRKRVILLAFDLILNAVTSFCVMDGTYIQKINQALPKNNFDTIFIIPNSFCFNTIAKKSFRGSPLGQVVKYQGVAPGFN